MVGSKSILGLTRRAKLQMPAEPSDRLKTIGF